MGKITKGKRTGPRARPARHSSHRSSDQSEPAAPVTRAPFTRQVFSSGHNFGTMGPSTPADDRSRVPTAAMRIMAVTFQIFFPFSAFRLGLFIIETDVRGVRECGG